MKSVSMAHALAAGALIIGSAVTVRFVAILPFWFGILVGLSLYALIIFVAKADEDVP